MNGVLFDIHYEGNDFYHTSHTKIRNEDDKEPTTMTAQGNESGTRNAVNEKTTLPKHDRI